MILVHRETGIYLTNKRWATRSEPDNQLLPTPMLSDRSDGLPQNLEAPWAYTAALLFLAACVLQHPTQVT